MDKSSGNSDSRDMTLGCGPSTSTTSLSTALSSSSSSTSSPPSSSSSSSTATSSSSSTTGASSATASSSSSSSANSGSTLPPPPPPPPITLNISTTTGGNFTVVVEVSNSVENLKKIIAKKLKVAKDRIRLLHREKELQDGILKDNGLMDGSKIILIPNVETGLLAQRPENTVMQALESLNDSQVNDFLSGKTPLNLSMRLGDHMMLIQLQLSTVNPTSPSSSTTSRSRSSQRSSRSSSNQTSTSLLNTASGNSSSSNGSSHIHHHHSSASRKLNVDAATASVSSSSNSVSLDSNTTATSSRMATSNSQQAASTLSHSHIRTPTGRDLSSYLTKRDFESLHNIVKSISMAQQQPSSIAQAVAATTASTSSMDVANGSAVVEKKATNCCTPVASSSYGLMEQSPIKSLSNLVSSPIKTTSIKNIPISSHPKYTSELANGSTSQTAGGSSTTCSDPISAKLTSCLCTRLNNSSKSCEVNPCQSRSEVSAADFVTERTLITSTPIYKLKPSGSSHSLPASSSTSSSASSSPVCALLHKTVNNPIAKSKHRHHHHHHHHHHHYHHHGSNGSNTLLGTSRKSLPAEDTNTEDKNRSASSDSTDSALSLSTTSTTSSQENSNQSASSSNSSVSETTSPAVELDDSGITVTDTRTLAEASRNLTQTLRKLSKEVFTNKIDLSNEEIARKSSSGAVIESMKNHGKGIYSGTFSGTLNPALQDRYGRPKRDISTVIHILNDLLSATPQYSRGAKISFEAPSTSSSRSKQTSSSKSQSSSSAASSESTCIKCSGNSTCAYGECTGHYSTKPLTSSSSCADPEKLSSMCECTDLSPTTGTGAACPSIDCTDTDERNLCKCRYLFPGGRQRGQMCLKCTTDMANNKTKFKLDQLRLVMQQRKQKREARKLKGAPYGARVVTTSPSAAAAGGATTTASATASTIAPLASPSEVSPNHIVEEVDTAA